MGHQHSLDAPPGMAKYASEALRNALASAAVSRGHASLLCGLRDQTQRAALTGLLALPSLPGVDELKQGIEAKAVPLRSVAFNLDDCGACRFNTSNHADLFGSSITPGLCVNTECAASKWQTHIQLEQGLLATRHRVVKIVPADERQHIRPIVPDGPTGVGPDQAKICAAECAHFGAALCGSVNTKVQAREDVCTNPSCNDAMVEQARLEGLRASRDKLWRGALSQHVELLPRPANRAVLMAMLSCGWSAPSEMRSEARLEGQTAPAAILKAWLTMPEGDLLGRMDAAAGLLVARAPAHQVGEMLRALRVKLQDYSVMSVDFLKRLSVSEIEEVLSDLKVPTSDELRRAKRSGQEAYSTAAMACITSEMLEGYVPSVFRY